MALVCLFIPLKDKAGNRNDSTACLYLVGVIENATESADTCFIEFITPDMKIDTLFLKPGRKKFRCQLRKNEYYTVRISKKGYVPKLICINTEMLNDPGRLGWFEFETSLFKKETAEKLNKDALDFPVAIIYFDRQKETFAYNENYTKDLLKELYKPGSRQ